MPMQVNITTKVNSQSIRRETYNGREHLVLPSYTLPANVVMNGGLYTQEQIDAHYQGLEGTLAPLGHPQVNGQFVSAFSPEGINASHIGAWNRNVKKSGNRIYLEKWVDVARASESEGGRELLERVAAIERGEDVPPIHTSVAAFLDQLEPNEQQRATGAEWVAKIYSMDHDAILLHEVGAATPEQGVGLMVNADLAQPLKANSGALVGESYREREQRLDRAAKAKFAPGTDEYAWVADFTDSQVVIVRNGGDAQVYGYSADGGKITIDDTGTAVARQESWVAVVANKFKALFTPQEQPAPNHKTEGDMPLTTEEKQELISDRSAGQSGQACRNPDCQLSRRRENKARSGCEGPWRYRRERSVRRSSGRDVQVAGRSCAAGHQQCSAAQRNRRTSRRRTLQVRSRNNATLSSR
ncbi:hypothetical protein [Enterobacter cloacae]|uniref:hypothetical protein n=1 Tax=Enterobacter cloacae TaxID=550 RepID=UPI003F687FDF